MSCPSLRQARASAHSSSLPCAALPPPLCRAWQQVMGVNLEGSRNAAQAVYPFMREAGRGKVSDGRGGAVHPSRAPCFAPRAPPAAGKNGTRARGPDAHGPADAQRPPACQVIFISSVAGKKGAGTQVAYACSKGALLPLTRSLAAAWGGDK